MTMRIPRALLVAALLASFPAACVHVPHGARVTPGSYRAFSVGAGAALVRSGSADTIAAAERWTPTPVVQLTVGRAWERQRVLGYVTIPLLSAPAHAAISEEDPVEHVFVAGGAALLGTALGIYKQVGPADSIFAFGIGGLAAIGPPQGQLYVLTGVDLGGASLSAGARAGGIIDYFGDYRPVAVTGAFGSMRVPVGRKRIGVWVDAGLATRNEIPDFGEGPRRSMDAVLLAGLVVETR